MSYAGTIGYRAAYMGQVHEGFMSSFIAALEFLHQESDDEYYFARGLSCLPHQSANQLTANFRGDWLLMLDTDHVFRNDFFVEMISAFNSQGLDILSAFTQKRQPPFHPVLFRTQFIPGVPPDTIFPDKNDYGLIPIDSGGAACLMVRRKVFDEIKKSGEDPFDFVLGRRDMGEDAAFYYRAKRLGFQAYCAPWIKYHHLETRIVTDDMIVLPAKMPLI